MHVRSVIQWIYMHFVQRKFRSRDVLKHQYLPFDTSMSGIYTAIHRCWKMGFLTRRKQFGRTYFYRMTERGIRYVEDGHNYRTDTVRLKLLGYIVKYGDEADHDWADKYLAPKLLRRFLPGKIAQDIKLPSAFFDVVMNVTHPLRQRVREEAIFSSWDFLTEYYQDQLILINVHRLCQLLYPEKVNPLNPAVLRSQRILALDELIDELKHPLKFISVLNPFPTPPTEDRPNPLKLKPKFVPRPTAKGRSV
jgi:hypothetical protein